MGDDKQLYDVISESGRVLNAEPLSYREAFMLSLTAEQKLWKPTTVVLSTRQPSRRWGVGRVVALVLLGVMWFGLIVVAFRAWRAGA